METKKEGNRGFLMANKKKSKETQPDYFGRLTVGSVNFSLSGWKSKSKNGMDYLSLSLSLSDFQKNKSQVSESETCTEGCDF